MTNHLSIYGRLGKNHRGQTPHAVFCVGALLIFGAFRSSAVSADEFGTGDNAFVIDFVHIGNAGNPADTEGKPNPAGSVDYEYRIGQSLITFDMIDKANLEAQLGITHPPARIPPGRPLDAPFLVNWYEAARFVNWLNENHGFPHAYKFETQPGENGYDANASNLLWEEGEDGFDAGNRYRNQLAHYFLPSVDEWYKAAHYDPNANDGAGRYWEYTNGSDLIPSLPEDLTPSPYGVILHGSRYGEWEETEEDLINDAPSFPQPPPAPPFGMRGTRGGPGIPGIVASRNHRTPTPARFYLPEGIPDNNGNAFRVASLPIDAPLPGDFDGDGLLTAADIDLLSIAVSNPDEIDRQFDLNNDGLINSSDYSHWIHEERGTWFGDSNLDAEFNTSDLTQVFQAGTYELDEQAGWAEGDWNGDERFDSTDMILAFQDGGFEKGTRAQTTPVPEPTSAFLLLISGIIAACWYRQRPIRSDSAERHSNRKAFPWSYFSLFLIFVGLLTSRVVADEFGTGENAFEIDFVSIGDAGNAADTLGTPKPAGAVAYDYRLGQALVTRNMVEMANREGGLGISMDVLGLEQFPDPGVMPATVTWFQAARFVNWLNESQGYPPAYKFESRPGEAGYDSNASMLLWEDGDDGFDANNSFRNQNAHYFLPSTHEWYKAAHYDPNANDGAGGYWGYYGTDTEPESWAELADMVSSYGIAPPIYGGPPFARPLFEWEETELDLVNDTPAVPSDLSGGYRGVRGGIDSAVFDYSRVARRGFHTTQRRSNAAIPLFFLRPAFRVASFPIDVPPLGDFDNDGQLTAADIDLLDVAISNPDEIDRRFDLNNDGLINSSDRTHWVHEERGTWFGDSNLDGEFNTSDLTLVFQAGKYELDELVGWAEGDWNGDSRFDSTDVIFAFQDGGFEKGTRAQTMAVPEPTSLTFFAFGMMAVFRRRG